MIGLRQSLVNGSISLSLLLEVCSWSLLYLLCHLISALDPNVAMALYLYLHGFFDEWMIYVEERERNSQAQSR